MRGTTRLLRAGHYAIDIHRLSRTGNSDSKQNDGHEGAPLGY